MLTLLRTLSLGYVRQRLARSVLIVLLIALGVATLVATQALSKSLKIGVEEGVNPLAKLFDIILVNGDTGVHLDLARELRAAQLDGIENVMPLILTRMSVADLNNKQVWLWGVEWVKNKGGADAAEEAKKLGITIHLDYQPRTLLEKMAILVAPPALVTEQLASELEQTHPKSRRFKLRTAGQTPEVTRMGTIGLGDSDLPLNKSHVVLMELNNASLICFPEKPGYVHQIGVRLALGADLEEVSERLRQWVGQRADVRSIETSKQMVSDVTAGLEIGFTIGGAGALVVGLFLVYNALSVSVAERRHDIGILRSVGATRYQIAGLFMGESFLMGLIGSALGLPLGWSLARLAIGPLANTTSELMVPIDSPQLLFPTWLMIVAVISGTAVAVLAALVPAMQAASEEPADAVRRVPRRDQVIYFALQITASLLLMLAGVLMVRYREQMPLRTGMFAGIVCLVLSGLVSTPFFSAIFGRILQPLFRYLLGLEGRLAADNLVRTPGRTGLVIAALAATAALMVQTSGFLKSTRVGIYDWLEEKIDADLFVTAGSPVTSGGAALTMPEEFEEKLKVIDGVEAVLPVRMHEVGYYSQRTGQNHYVFLIALDTAAFDQVKTERPLARNLSKFPRLREKGTVVVSENFAALYGVKVGDFIQIPARDEMLKVEVVGLATDYTWNRGTILMDRAWYREKYVDHQISVFDLFLKPQADAQQIHDEILARYGEQYNLFILNRPDVHRDVHRTLTRVYAFVYAQQAIVGMVALLGVVSALFISVLQRRRELGLLRAVGASRGQILRSVLAEAVLMGLIGAIIGFAIGLLLEWYVLDILIFDESGFTFPMQIPWVEAGIVCFSAVLFATLAGLWPAYHATTLRIPDAIAYE